MPTIRTGNGAYAIVSLGGSTGAAENTVGAIHGSTVVQQPPVPDLILLWPTFGAEADAVQGAALTATVDDTLILVDTIAQETAKPVSDTLILNDSASHGVEQVVPDTLTLADLIASTNLGKEVTVEDSVGLADIARLDTQRPVTDTLVLADTQLRLVEKSIADTFTLSDQLGLDSVCALADSLSLLDNVITAQGMGYFVTPTDTLAVADSVLIGHGRAVTHADALTLADAFAHEIRKAVLDTAAVSDAIALAWARAISQADTLGLSDAARTTLERLTVDLLTLSDAVATGIGRGVLQDDNLPLTDSITLDVDLSDPTPTITTDPDRTRISRVAGRDVTTFSFQVDEAYQAYKLKVVPGTSSPHTAGTLIESGGGGAVNTPIQVDVTDDELVAAGQGEGTYVLKVFVQDMAGRWSL